MDTRPGRSAGTRIPSPPGARSGCVARTLEFSARAGQVSSQERGSQSRRVGRSTQTDARAEPARPEDGADKRRLAGPRQATRQAPRLGRFSSALKPSALAEGQKRAAARLYSTSSTAL